MQQPVTKFLASGAFLGYLPPAPGTLGTLWGIPIFYGLSRYSPGIQAVASVLFILAAVFLSGRAARAWGKKDPTRVVIDETAGYLAAVCWLPFNWITVGGGFLIFRILDIFKPFPIRKIDRELSGGWGIVLDDVLAGIFTNILLRLIMAFMG